MAVKRIGLLEAPDGTIDSIDKYQFATLISFGTSGGGSGGGEIKKYPFYITKILRIINKTKHILDLFTGKLHKKIGSEN